MTGSTGQVALVVGGGSGMGRAGAVALAARAAEFEMYRFMGPIGFLKKQLSDSLLGPEAVAAQPDQARTIIESFATADRDGPRSTPCGR